MAFNDVISRVDAQALMPEDVQHEIVQSVPNQSVIMQLGRRLPDMSRAQRRIPVLGSLINAQFVGADTGLKQTGKELWANKFINADELAVIVPIPETVLDDVDYDIWGEIRPRIVEALGLAVDLAVLFGIGAPADWPINLMSGALAAGNLKSLANFVDVYDAVMGESGTLGTVEQDGFDINGHVAALSMKAKLRGLRDANGNPIFLQSNLTGTGGVGTPGAGIGGGITRYELDGSPMFFPKNGGFDPSQALMFSGDWSQLVWAIRQDITFKLLDQSVLTDNAGNIVFNLPQQDMVALRAVIRLGWQLPNPINRVRPIEGQRYPFGVLTA